VQEKFFLHTPRHRPLLLVCDKRGLAQIAAFWPFARPAPPPFSHPGRQWRATFFCVPQTADCGARVPCGTLRPCTLAAPMSESSWVLCGHGPLPHSSLPTHPQEPGQAAARILNTGSPSSPQPPFPLWQQDSFVVDLSHSPSRLHHAPALDRNPLL
jgi:hypothetical protein